MLTYCNITTDPDGNAVTASARLDEVPDRYGPDHVVTKSITAARPAILNSVSVIVAALDGRLG